MIGKAIKKMRKIEGLSQFQLASLLKIGSNNISRYENGNRQITFETLEEIAKTCGFHIVFIHPEKDIRFELEDLKREDI